MGNTYQVRTITANGGDLPVSGGVIREEHLNDEFTSIVAAFNASTGHSHNGTDSPEVETLGANQELKTTSTSIFPNTTTIDIGTTGAKFRDVFISRHIKIDSSGSIQTSTITDASGNESIKLVATGSAVNEITVTNAATNNDVSISATGTDTNVSLVLTPKGSGLIKLAKDDLAIGGTAVTTTAAELNVLDGDVTSIGTTAVVGGDGIITSDNGTMRSTSVDTFDTYLSATNKTLTNKTLTTPTLTSPVINTSVSGTAIDTDLTSVSGSDDTLASAKAIKTYVDAQKADMQFVLEDGDGTEVQITRDKEVKFVEGGGININWTDTTDGTDADPYDLSFTVTDLDTTHLAASALVIESEGIGSNDNDTTLPTSAAVKDYVDTQIATKDNTDEITEGSSNLYFTNARADARADARITAVLQDDDGFSSSSATNIASSESIKAYVDAQVGGVTVPVTLTNAVTLTNKHLGVTSEEYISIGNMGSSQSLNLNDDVVFLGTLNSATCTISFTESFGDTKAYGFSIILLQDGTGNRAITWPSAIRWADGGNAPSISTTASRYDVFTFLTYDAGANYHGFHAATNQY